jgi:hypothetical protein
METTSFIHFGTPRAEQIHILAYFPPSFLDDGMRKLRATSFFSRAQKVHEAWRAYLLDFVSRQDERVRAALDEPWLRSLSVDDTPQLQTFILRIGERCPDLYGAFQLDHVHFWENRALFGWEPEELIEAIRAEDGVDVVAHPIRYRDKERLERVLDVVSGIEVYTSRHNAEVSKRFLAMASEKGKHWTASSDDHQHRPYVHPASGTPRRTVERILGG